MTPEQTLKKMDHYLKSMKEAKKSYVAVGITGQEKDKPYKGGASLVEVAAIHEYGLGDMTKRSFLKLPMELKQKELSVIIGKAFERVIEGMEVKRGLSLVGLEAVNISKGAFPTSGYGKWKDVSEETKRRKRSSKPLIDTGQLVQSITFEVRS